MEFSPLELFAEEFEGVKRIIEKEEKNRLRRLKAQSAKEESKAYRNVMQYMNEAALAAMHTSAVESLAAQLLGIAELKQNRELAQQERDAQSKLHNIGLFMGQLTAIAERQTKNPDWGEW